MASYVLKGRYSLRICGYTIDDSLHIPRAILLTPDDQHGHPAPVRIVDPIAALAVVAYNWNEAGTGGALWGTGILRRLSRAVLQVGPNVPPTPPAYVYQGTSALDGALGVAPAPMKLKTFQILPISRYWVDGPGNLTGRAVMFVKHGTGDLDKSDVSVLSFYLVVEDREPKTDVGTKVALIATDTRFFTAPFSMAGGWVIQPPTFIEWGTQTRIDDAVEPPPDLAELDAGVRQRMVDFAAMLGV